MTLKSISRHVLPPLEGMSTDELFDAAADYGYLNIYTFECNLDTREYKAILSPPKRAGIEFTIRSKKHTTPKAAILDAMKIAVEELNPITGATK